MFRIVFNNRRGGIDGGAVPLKTLKKIPKPKVVGPITPASAATRMVASTRREFLLDRLLRADKGSEYKWSRKEPTPSLDSGSAANLICPELHGDYY